MMPSSRAGVSEKYVSVATTSLRWLTLAAGNRLLKCLRKRWTSVHTRKMGGMIKHMLDRCDGTKPKLGEDP